MQVAHQFQVWTIVAGLMLCLAHASSAQVTRDAAACSALASLRIPGIDLAITGTQWYSPGAPLPPAGRGGPALKLDLPAYCRLDGIIDRRTGADGKEYGIRFALALPGEWNGRFLFQGGGGLNGRVLPPVGGTAAGDRPALARGFAVVSTDTGHSGEVFDASFMREQQAALDFAYQAVGRVALLAKQLIAQYYARPADRSYFSGCSTGGREAMLMAQRHPTYFDGIISGAPAMRTNFSGIGDEWVATMLNQVAPKGADGRPMTRQALSDANKRAVIDGFLNACDADDGLADRMVFNTRACQFDPKRLVCDARKAEGCLSAEQGDALVRAFAGPKDSKGRQVYPGFLFDTGIAATDGIPGLLHGGANPVGPPFSATTLDVDARAEEAAADPTESLTAASRWTNLNTFSSGGGKLMFFHGISDPWFSALDTIDYYERMMKANGGPDAVRRWSRLYLSPGMAHCAGGPAALDEMDMLTALVDWVEKGTIPRSVTATGTAFPGRSRPLCSYPEYARYKGQGDQEKAESFECRE